MYIIQLHRKYTLNSTLIGPVVTFHKYSYNRNGSVNIGRLVLLYIPKHRDPFIPHLVLGVMHVAKKKQKQKSLNCFSLESKYIGNIVG